MKRVKANDGEYCKSINSVSMAACPSFSGSKCWKRILLFVCCGLMTINSFGQQALGQRPRVKSPVLNADGTVTFNFFDPTAQRVSVTGDFREISGQTLQMNQVMKSAMQQAKTASTQQLRQRSM